MNNPRPHCEVIKAWADGAEVQWLNPCGTWEDCHNPQWGVHAKYRVKPEEPELIPFELTKEEINMIHELRAKKATSHWCDDLNNNLTN